MMGAYGVILCKSRMTRGDAAEQVPIAETGKGRNDGSNYEAGTTLLT